MDTSSPHCASPAFPFRWVNFKPPFSEKSRELPDRQFERILSLHADFGFTDFARLGLPQRVPILTARPFYLTKMVWVEVEQVVAQTIFSICEGPGPILTNSSKCQPVNFLDTFAQFI